MLPFLAMMPAHAGARHDLVAVLVEHDGVLVDRHARAAGVRLALGHDAGAAEAGLRGADRVGDDPVGQQFEELLLDAGREQRGGAGEQEQRRQVVARCRRPECGQQRVEQRAGHRVTGEEQQVHLVLVDRPPHLVGVEFRCQHRGLAGEQRHPGGRLGGAVDHRRDRVAGSSAGSPRPALARSYSSATAHRSRSRCRRTAPGRCPRAATSRPWGSRWCRRCRAGRCRRRCAAPKSRSGEPCSSAE